MALKSATAAQPLWKLADAPSVLRGQDNGPPIRITAEHLQTSGDRWFRAFLDANRTQLQRLNIVAEVRAGATTDLVLHPNEYIGAIPLLSPITRRVVAGLTISPRLGWHSLGSTLGAIGFRVEPAIGGSLLVPGSAREVPAWLLAAPIIQRIEQYLLHRKQGFIEKHETRLSPRGRIDWSRWARAQLPTGHWNHFPCTFYESGDDPDFVSAIRWTLMTLDHELQFYEGTPAARNLRKRIALLQPALGAGPVHRPNATFITSGSEWIEAVSEAIQWVVEERGLGGRHRLDGVSWSLSIHEVWEAWVDRIIHDLSSRLGMHHVPRHQTQRGIHWETPLRSMTKLVPDCAMTGNNRAIWVDAKYKPHLQHIARTGWHGLSADMQNAHRADLHQALAYTSLSDDTVIDSLLVYPLLSTDVPFQHALATLTSGRRLLRLHLVGIPFGVASTNQHELILSNMRNAILPLEIR